MVKDEFSTVQEHAGWFQQRACYPLHDAHPRQLEAQWQRWQNAARDEKAMPWKCLGPSSVAGRMTSLLMHPTDGKRLYAGAAAGGVWTSPDGGATWKACWPKWANPCIGVLAFDPTDPKTIYCGTGEANLSTDSYPGSGIYVTRDAAATWELLCPAEDEVIPRRIGALAISTRIPGTMYLGGVNMAESQAGGFYRSCDGGKSWQRDSSVTTRSYWCHSIALHPDGTLFASFAFHGSQTGIWRGKEGETPGWEQLGDKLPSGDKIGRIGIALAPSKPDTMYALVADRFGQDVAGVYRSRSRGERWTEIGGSHFAAEAQACYNNAIAVHPTNADIVACGLNDVHITRDAGATWERASHWDAQVGSAKYTHSDHHAILLPGGDLIYSANDGGIAMSEHLGDPWKDIGAGLVTTMFYDIDVAPSNGKFLGGGTQDNGTLICTAGSGEFERALDGDGAWMVFDPDDETHVFGSRSDIHIFRHAPNKEWAIDFWEEVSPKGLKDFEHHSVSVAVMAIDPGDGHKVWAGSHRLWLTINDGKEWTPRSPVLDRSAITAIEIPSRTPQRILVGTVNGGIFRSLDDGATWSGNLSSTEIPRRAITRIESHPQNPSRIVVTCGGTGVVSRAVPMAMRYGAPALTSGPENISHVFLSEDGGLTWKPIDTGEMPHVAYHAAAFETHEPYRLFVSNDCGVWMSDDLAAWTDISQNLPNAMFSDLVYHHRDRTLTAASYGRGIWQVVVNPVATVAPDVANR